MPGRDGPAVQALTLQQLGIMAAHIRARPQDADVPGADALFERAQALWQALGDQRRANARRGLQGHAAACSGLSTRACQPCQKVDDCADC